MENHSKCTYSKYITKNARFKGEGEGPLQVQGRNAGYFVLRHLTKKKCELTTEYWETDACNIRLLPRKMQKRSYLAFDEEANRALYVHSSQNDRRNILTRFRLFRVGIEHMRCQLGSTEFDDRILKHERNPQVVSDGDEEDTCVELEEEERGSQEAIKWESSKNANLGYEELNEELNDEDSSDEDDWLWESDGNGD